MHQITIEQKLGLLQNQLNLISSKFPKINYGGCGTFSYYVSEILDKHNINNQIVYFEEKNTPPGSFRCDVKFTHILIKTDYCFIDNIGFYSLHSDNPDSWVNNVKLLSKQKLYEMLKETRLWNNIFGEEQRQLLAKEINKIKL